MYIVVGVLRYAALYQSVNVLCPWVKCKKEGKDQESIQSSTTTDPGYHMGKLQIHIKHRTREKFILAHYWCNPGRPVLT